MIINNFLPFRLSGVRGRDEEMQLGTVGLLVSPKASKLVATIVRIKFS